MALSEFSVAEVNPPNVSEKLVIHCLDGLQLVLVLVPWSAIDTYFGREMNQASRKLLVRINLNRLIPIIQGKYERDRDVLGRYFNHAGQSFPQIDLELSDLQQAGPLSGQQEPETGPVFYSPTVEL